MGLDRDTPFAFQIHGIKQLILLVTICYRIGHLQETVGKGGFPVIDMGDDAEIAGKRYGHWQSVTIR